MLPARYLHPSRPTGEAGRPPSPLLPRPLGPIPSASPSRGVRGGGYRVTDTRRTRRPATAASCGYRRRRRRRRRRSTSPPRDAPGVYTASFYPASGTSLRRYSVKGPVKREILA
ncbi:hypothetical protein EJ08DRAFT_700001 [Tothia fuscella]|uniref:Uncharacterized protein n=1 Tax=Tothia fuscella TaxID=1048955 RepID=A0A9P4NL85_9PEZI|nr:hypothetical protein EJ08DRAFT_700001 [Tothia fuscella]